MKIILTVLICFLFFCLTTNAQWTQCNGPYGGEINTLTKIVANIFAGCQGGVFLTTNNGENWTAVNNGLRTAPYALGVSGTNLFAGGYGGKIFLSTDYGSNWKEITIDSINREIKSFVSIGTNVFVVTTYGVFLTTNNGQSWAVQFTNEGNYPIKNIAVAGNHLFSGTAQHGLFLSTNNGMNWNKVNIGLNAEKVSINSLISNNKVILATIDTAGLKSMQFISTDNGENWKQTST